eukprot:15328843-Ditylum_brightwellii.AAC.1
MECLIKDTSTFTQVSSKKIRKDAKHNESTKWLNVDKESIQHVQDTAWINITSDKLQTAVKHHEYLSAPGLDQ